MKKLLLKSVLLCVNLWPAFAFAGTNAAVTVNTNTGQLSNLGFSTGGMGMFWSNSATHAWGQIPTNSHLHFTDENGSTYDFKTNGAFIISNLSGSYVCITNGNILFSGTITGNGSGLTGVSGGSAALPAAQITGTITNAINTTNAATVSNLTSTGIITEQANTIITNGFVGKLDLYGDSGDDQMIVWTSFDGGGSGAVDVNGGIILEGAANFQGDGTYITGLSPSQLTGTGIIPSAAFGGLTNLATSLANWLLGANSSLSSSNLTASNITATIGFTGNGGGLTNLPVLIPFAVTLSSSGSVYVDLTGSITSGSLPATNYGAITPIDFNGILQGIGAGLSTPSGASGTNYAIYLMTNGIIDISHVIPFLVGAVDYNHAVATNWNLPIGPANAITNLGFYISNQVPTTLRWNGIAYLLK